MNLLFLRFFLVLALLKCFTSGQDDENNVLEQPPEKSRFKKFLNLFGIGTMKQFQPGDSVPEFSPYGYPCHAATTTTTPAPITHPLLCPFPPVMPGQMRPHDLGDGHGHEIPPKGLPRPVALDHLGSPPPGTFPLPPPPHFNGQRPHGPNPPTPLPGQVPQSPFPPPIKPLPGQVPQFPGPFPTFPGQKPFENFPWPVQHFPNGPNDPSLTRPGFPMNPEQPVLVDPGNPINPANPVQVNPDPNNPFDPVKINPTIADGSKPIQVNPVDINPSNPVLIDPINPGRPVIVEPNNNNINQGPGPMIVDPSQTPTDPKEFYNNNNQPLQPYGPMNVLINPGLPDLPFPGRFPPIGPFLPRPNGDNPFGPPPPLNESGSSDNNSPVSVPPSERPKPNCASPFLRPYIPNGFHVSSVKQLTPPPVPSQRPHPCPTLDLLTVLEFNTMRSLINSSGLAPLVDHTRNYTLFAPSDAAFRKLPKWFRQSLEADAKLKKALVLNHLVKEDLPLDLLKNDELVLSARPGGNRLRVNVYQPDNAYRTITVDGSEVEIGDILSSNGRVHIVNKVLIPNLPRNGAEFLSEKLEFEGFWNHVKQAEMVPRFQDESPFTLFIPVNEAVQKLNDSAFLNDKEKLKNFVNYHLVNGTYYSSGIVNNEFLLTNYEKEIKMQVVTDSFSKSLVGINGKVKILKADITLTNGVAHVIDHCISEEAPFYVYPQSDEFQNEYGVMKRSFRVTSEEKNIENAF